MCECVETLLVQSNCTIAHEKRHKNRATVTSYTQSMSAIICRLRTNSHVQSLYFVHNLSQLFRHFHKAISMLIVTITL